MDFITPSSVQRLETTTSVNSNINFNLLPCKLSYKANIHRFHTDAAQIYSSNVESTCKGKLTVVHFDY